MTSTYRNLLLGGILGFCAIAPQTMPAASGCLNSQLFGVYGVQATNIALQSALRPIASVPPGTTNATVLGFIGNPSSLSGNMAGLGRYYLDGTGNVTGLTAATSTLPAINTTVGKYNVNTDCSGSVTFNSGAAYDIYISGNGGMVEYLRTDSGGGGEIGVLRRAGSCVNLNYPGSYTFQVGGGTNQTTTTGSTATTLAPYSALGAFTLNGSGAFTMTESLYNSSGTQRSTASGTYTVGADCSVTLAFGTAPDSNSKNFVAPASFKILMLGGSSGLLTLMPDSNTVLNGTVTSQSSLNQ